MKLELNWKSEANELRTQTHAHDPIAYAIHHTIRLAVTSQKRATHTSSSLLGKVQVGGGGD